MSNKTPKKSRRYPKVHEIAQESKDAWQLRLTGMTYEAIAEKMGLTLFVAYDRVQRYYREVQAETREMAAEARERDLARIDELLTTWWPKSVGENADKDAVATVLKLLERRSKILGLDAPTKAEHSGPQGGPIPVVNASVNVVLQLDGEEMDLVDWARDRYNAQAERSGLPPIVSTNGYAHGNDGDGQETGEG